MNVQEKQEQQCRMKERQLPTVHEVSIIIPPLTLNHRCHSAYSGRNTESNITPKREIKHQPHVVDVYESPSVSESSIQKTQVYDTLSDSESSGYSNNQRSDTTSNGEEDDSISVLSHSTVNVPVPVRSKQFKRSMETIQGSPKRRKTDNKINKTKDGGSPTFRDILTCIKKTVEKSVKKAVENSIATTTSDGSGEISAARIPVLSELPVPNEDGKVALVPGSMRVNVEFCVPAVNATSMKLRANNLMNALWSEEERASIVLRRNKDKPTARLITASEIQTLIDSCLALQGLHKLPLDAVFTHKRMRQWIMEKLKAERWRKSKLSRKDNVVS